MGNLNISSGRKPGLSYLGGIFGEGGIEHYKQAKLEDGTTFLARLKEYDQCGWQLDPEGTGIHCASSGRTKFAESIAWIIVITCVVMIIYELYRMNIIPNNDGPKKQDYSLLITYSIFLGIAICYAGFFVLIRTNPDRYHYGTTNFWLGTQTVTNKMSTENVDKGPIWKTVHETEHTSEGGVEGQVKQIMKKIKNEGKYSEKVKGVQDEQVQKIITDKKAKVDKDIKKAVLEQSAQLKRDHAAELRAKHENSFGTIFGKGDGINGYSEAGFCDICAEITGREVKDANGNVQFEEGDCNTKGRCWLAVVIFSLFTIYFVIMGSIILSDYEPTPEGGDPNDDIFRNVIGSICIIMAIICGLSIIPMLWSIYYCPSGSEFIRKSWPWGYEKSFRW